MGNECKQDEKEAKGDRSGGAPGYAPVSAKFIKGDFDFDGEKCHTLMGGDTSNPSWNEYVDGFVEDFQPYICGIKECVEKEGIIGAVGGDYANDWHFSFEDGTKVAFSWRAWGDMMQSIVNKNEGYMRYYM